MTTTKIKVFIYILTAIFVFLNIFMCIPSNAVDPVVIVLDPGHGGDDPGAIKKVGGVSYEEEVYVRKIATYIKNELDKYEGVDCYLTRVDDYNLSLTARSTYAYNIGADIFVSLHINSSDAASANGSEIYVSGGTYLPELASSMERLGTEILDGFAECGMRNRGIKTRLLTPSSLTNYPNGGTADYYDVIRRNVLFNIPAMIIEHAFISNSSDLAKLNDDNVLSQLAHVTASSLVKHFKLSLRNSSSTTKPITNSLPQGYLNIIGLKTSLTFGDKLTLGTSGGSGSGNVVYEVNDDRILSLDGNILNTEGSGSIRVGVTKWGDNTYAPISCAIYTVKVKPLTSAIILSAKTYSGAGGKQDVYLSASLTNFVENKAPKGRVQFYNGNFLVGEASFSSIGTATYVWAGVETGTYSLKASYSSTLYDGYNITGASASYNVDQTNITPVPTASPTPIPTEVKTVPKHTASPVITGAPTTDVPQTTDEPDVISYILSRRSIILICAIVLLAVIFVFVLARVKSKNQ